MDEQTRKLLEECTSGCKMAVSSIQQILEFTQDSALQKILNKYIEQHTHLQQTAESQLSADGFEPKIRECLLQHFPGLQQKSSWA